MSAELLSDIRIDAMNSIRSASEQSREAFQMIKMSAAARITHAKRETPALMGEIAFGTKHVIRTCQFDIKALVAGVVERARRDVVQARTAADESLRVVTASARTLVRQASITSEALMREITGQGPDNTLGRGFALVRTLDGQSVTRASSVQQGSSLEIQFSDGRVTATADKQL